MNTFSTYSSKLFGKNSKYIWLEVSVTVEPETVDVVAETLGRFSCGGVSIEPSEASSDTCSDRCEKEFVNQTYKYVEVRAYLKVSTNLKDKIHQLERELWPLGMIARQSGLMVPKPEYKPIEDTNWSTIWRDQYKPLRIGRKLIVIPPWTNIETESSDTAIIIDPGQAFGTGAHPSTQLCLQAIEQHLIPGDSVLDLGCGSGILAITALKLGAHLVTGLDTDHDSMNAARQNAIVNNVFDRFQLVQGSLDAIKKQQQYRIVVVNILSRTIIQLIENDLSNTVAKNGILILSGILAEQSAEIELALDDVGMILISKIKMTESTHTTCQWVSLIYSKELTDKQVSKTFE